MKGVLLFNPRSAPSKPRIPNSVLQVAASIDGKIPWVIVDGNREADPWPKIYEYLDSGKFNVFASTVMPGPQLKQAIPISKMVRERYKDIKIAWGGYFPSNHTRITLESGFVDFVITGMGDVTFPLLAEQLTMDRIVDAMPNLAFMRNGSIVSGPKDPIYEPGELPALPYEKLDRLYSMDAYLGKTWLGNKTIAYHSSFGCPFTCSFCAVVPIYNARWKGAPASRIYKDILYIKEKWGADAIEFHDNNFFVSEKRTREFSELIMHEGMTWWGEGRIDTIDQYSDETLRLMRSAGCRMIFFGAETGNDALLKKMDKGGTQNAEQILQFAARMKQFDIIPEFSFVLGFPAESPEAALKQVEEDISFIRKIKSVNDQAEIIIYVYSPVPLEGSALYEAAKKEGFRFPNSLEEWLNPAWEKFDLRKNPLTPWLNTHIIGKIRNFETVLNGYYPTISDIRLKPLRRKTMKALAALRYHREFYHAPYELKAMQKIWKYRQPEKEGF